MAISEPSNASVSSTRLEKVRAHLADIGLENVGNIVHNPSYEDLFEAEMSPELSGYEKGVLTDSGAVNVDTGVYTGRSP